MVKDRNGKELKRGDTVRITGDSGLWIVFGFDGADVEIESLSGQKLTRFNQHVAKLNWGGDMDPLKLNWKKVGGDRVSELKYTSIPFMDECEIDKMIVSRDNRIKELELNAGLSEITLDHERSLRRSCETALGARHDRIAELEGQLEEANEVLEDYRALVNSK